MPVKMLDSEAFGINEYKIKETRWSPCEETSGTTEAVAGEDFVIVASDTRFAKDHHILTRNQSKLFKLSDKTILASTGCWCDVLAFVKNMEARMKIFLHQHNKEMSTEAIAQLISISLYNKTFFPYYISNIVAGLGKDERGTVYGYDPVGCIEKQTYLSAGSATTYIQPLLDNQIGRKNIHGEKYKMPTLEFAMSVIHDAFVSAVERDTTTGDGIIFNIITKDGVKVQTLPLPKD